MFGELFSKSAKCFDFTKFLMCTQQSVDYFQPQDQQNANIKYENWKIGLSPFCDP